MRCLRMTAVVVAVAAISAAVQADVTTTEWVEYASNPVYSPGKAYYPTILKEDGVYRMWSDGASGLQMATSTNGINWTTVGVASGLNNVRHPVVEKIGDVYRIWYWDNGQLYSINAMRTATSTDGLNWQNDTALTQVGTSVVSGGSGAWNRGSYGPGDVFYDPAGSASIVSPVDEASVWANRFVMYYDGTTGGDQAIGLAVSNDGVNWEGYLGGVSPVFQGTYVTGDWDRNYTTTGLTVIKENDDAYHLWYSGGDGVSHNGIGYAFSTDGINWVRATAPIFSRWDGESWRESRTYTPMVIGNEMWFTGVGGGVYAIGYATGASGEVIPAPPAVVLGGLGLGLVGLTRTIRRKRRG